MTRRSAIFANLLLTIPMITGLLGAAPSASAQTKMIATIPFNFSIGKHHMSAGTYSVERTSDCFLLVHNQKTNESRYLVIRKEDGRSDGSQAHLVFQQEGRAMYLTQAWFNPASEYVGTTQPKRDLEYAKSSPAKSRIEVALTQSPR